MNETILKGQGKEVMKIPREEWEHALADAPENIGAELTFMTEEHHLVRNFVVRELPLIRKPLSPEFIAEKIDLPVNRVINILDELEKKLTFSYRNETGEVVWAYHVTVEKTPHPITFSSGETLYAA